MKESREEKIVKKKRVMLTWNGSTSQPVRKKEEKSSLGFDPVDRPIAASPKFKSAKDTH
jgi:hypothetical protein